MKIKIAEIHFKDSKIEDYAIKKVEKLAKFHQRIESVTIRLTTERAHRKTNHSCFCELEFDIAGKNFVIRDSEKKIDKAIDKACERAKIALVKHKEKEISKKHRAQLNRKERSRS